MNSRAPAQLGMKIDEIETPALVVDLDQFERNLREMAAYVSSKGVRLRPHGKAHKSPDIALLQIANGAVGICCQKVSEAEAFVRAGVKDVLITNEIIDRRKLDLLVQLAQRVHIGLCADSSEQVMAAARAVKGKDVSLDVLIEIDVGHGRCGLPVGHALAQVAECISRSEGLRFAGLQAYHGSAQHFRSVTDRTAAIDRAVELVATAKQTLAAAGFQCSTVTGAGTGSFPLEIASGEYTEVQPGSYVFMDADYAKNEHARATPLFQQALLVHTTVMSIAVAGQAVLDGGYKAFSVDAGYPVAWQRDLPVLGMSDEHTRLRQHADEPLALGDRVRFVPSHIDPTVNLHDWYVCVRGGYVESLWPIAAKGPGL